MKKIIQENILGSWIPVEILFNPNITFLQKFLYWKICSLAKTKLGCFATNQYFADFFNVSIKTINEGIQNLKNNNYIESYNIWRKQRKVRFIRILDFNEEHKKYALNGSFNIEINTLDKINKKVYFNINKKVHTYKKKRYKNILSKKERIKLLHSAKAYAASSSPNKLFDYWNNLKGPFTKHNRGTKTEKEIKKILKIKLKKYSEREIIEAIDNFKTLLESKHQTFKPFQYKVGFLTFLEFSSFQKKAFLNNEGLKKIKSLFDECIKGEKYLIKQYGITVPKKYKFIDYCLREDYEKAFGDIENTFENNSYIKTACKKILRFVEDRDNNFREIPGRGSLIEYPQILSSILMDFLKEVRDRSKTNKIPIAYLASDKIFKGLREYMVENGMILED